MSQTTHSLASSVVCLPRYATARDPRCFTHGERVAQFAEQLGKPLMPWQRQVVDTALEVNAATGKLKYRRVILTVPRQSGKTTLLLALFAHRALGFGDSQVMSYAAQTGVDARKKFVDEHVPILDRSILAPLFKVRMTNGHEAVLWKNGSRHHISAGTEKSGHGATLDLAVVDEAFAQPDGRLEQAFSPAMVTRPEAQLWFVSTAGTPQHTWFRSKVEAGRQAVNSPGVAYFEWSASQDADPGDPDVWRACMPALGHTIDEDVIAAEFASMPLDEFRRAYLNQWVEDARTPEAIDPATWIALADPDTAKPASPVFAVATAPDHAWSAIGAAWRRSDGLLHVILSDYKPGTAWLALRIAELRARYGGQPIVDQATRGLVEGEGLSAAAVAQAQNTFADLVESGHLRHGNEPALLTAVQGARWRPAGESRVLDRKGNVDISPLVAVALAAQGVATSTSAYEERGMVML